MTSWVHGLVLNHCVTPAGLASFYSAHSGTCRQARASSWGAAPQVGGTRCDVKQLERHTRSGVGLITNSRLPAQAHRGLNWEEIPEMETLARRGTADAS